MDATCMRAPLATLAGLVLLAALPARVTSTAQDDPAFEQLASLVTQKMSEYDVPGVAFGVLRNGELTLRAFVVTNIDNPQPLRQLARESGRIHPHAGRWCRMGPCRRPDRTQGVIGCTTTYGSYPFATWARHEPGGQGQG
jgi:hypothetical protein